MNLELLKYSLNCKGHEPFYCHYSSALSDAELGEKVALFIESEKELVRLSSIDWGQYFTKYEKPKEIIYCRLFQETPSGKIDRKAGIKNN